MERQVTEAESWSRALGGDGAALGAVFDLHSDRVFRHAYAVLRDVHDAEDATATAFLELWRRRSSVRVIDGSVLPWLLVTAANCARNVARSRRRYRALLDSLPRGEHAESAEREAVAGMPVLDIVDGELGTQLRALPRTDYLLVMLTAVEGYSTSEAATAVGISASAARTRLSRVKARLRTPAASVPAPIGEEVGG
ncbi:sigma-70 family RNA polymerase sigma factor [Agromyces sp. SYSU K20354]|uniref:RNA polymerase sigma factor n=1 Tax=Agromyces cavernae TaxID=2898659 RepID=UPI001E38E95F|nr:sigma-70 family RNA polymerase sigma factor [Agromyces cavernae]MCD2440770.1 sigma-70 family RNA polymerase sigma factor [Agromyces cavernae]